MADTSGNNSHNDIPINKQRRSSSTNRRFTPGVPALINAWLTDTSLILAPSTKGIYLRINLAIPSFRSAVISIYYNRDRNL